MPSVAQFCLKISQMLFSNAMM